MDPSAESCDTGAMRACNGRRRPQTPLGAVTAPLLAGALSSFLGCAASHDYVWVQDLPQADDTARIRVGDTLSVLVRGQESLSGDFVVREDGTYLQPVVGPIEVEGKTAAQVEIVLEDALADGIVTRPEAAVAIGESSILKIHVLGEVDSPGTVEVAASDSLLTVLAKAGGLTEFARRDHIYVVRKKPQIRRIRFRYSDLVGADPAALGFQFRDGDAVVIE